MQTLREVLNQADKRRIAVGHFNVSDLVLLKPVFEAAKELKAPVIIGASEGERGFMGVRQIAALVKSLRSEFNFPIAVGVSIIHINTELRVAWRRSLEDSLARTPDEVVPYKILPPVVDSVTKVVKSRLRLSKLESLNGNACKAEWSCFRHWRP